MSQKKSKVSWIVFLITIVVVFALGILAKSITERKVEAQFVYTPKVEINQNDPRNEVWGENFPREFDTYYQTKDTSLRSLYNGNAMIDMLAVDPRLVVLWAGYGFSKDYNQGRGHYYAVSDLRSSLRTGAPKDANSGPMPSTCWTCKSPDVPRVMDRDGIASFYSGKWARLGPEINNFIGCADCHDAETMNLRISRPALVEAYARQGKDINKATHQEMRSLVCAQCHVEYYFDKHRPDAEGVPYLTFPWDKGKSVEDMEAYYDEKNFKDWTHKISKAPMLKAQHPGYEVYLTGIHAERGVSCADCHMPYKSEGGVKFTDHKIQSPLNNVANSCQVCHREETEQLIQDVYDRQKRVIESRDNLEIQLVHAHVEAGKCWELGATEEQMKDILMGIRHAQWRWDYAAASHGGSFHSPVEISRVIASGLDIVADTRLKLSRLLMQLGFEGEVPYPDIDTKAKAQEFIGLDMARLNADKKEFEKTVVPQWIDEAIEREKKMPVQLEH